jgi:alpha-N-arabinofuranosidase
VILRGNEEVQYRYPAPLTNVVKKPVNPFSGNFSFRDDFVNKPLNVRYTFLRTVTDKWYGTTDKKGYLSLQLRPQTVSGRENPSFIGFRQSHHQASASAKLNFVPAAENEKAGLVAFQNEEHFYYLCKSLANGKPVVQLYQSSKDSMKLLASKPLASGKQDVYLRIEPRNAVYATSYSIDGQKWIPVQEVDGRFLSTATAGGFVGTVIGLYATALGKESRTKAHYDWFLYKGDDAVFKPLLIPVNRVKGEIMK